ncbi:MAG: hypothetical protein IPO78_15135 [Saprospiraceae bacterium]|nr:hypothetical protein [Saprospiraceae bacterium]MBK9722927.1 hypothetical protein [Saprospiraceae bacterium]
MNLKYYVSLFFMVLLTMNHCDEKDAQCDPNKHNNKTYEITAPVSGHGGGLTYDTYVTGATRVYKWYRTTDNVCIFNLISISIGVRTFDEYKASDFNISAFEQHNIPISTTTIPLVADGKLLIGSAEINLLPSFVIGSGSFDTVVEVSFPTSGNPDQDQIYLLGKVAAISFFLKYSNN